MERAICPQCSAKVTMIARPKMGQRVVCGSCKSELEVVWLDPVELDWPYEIDDEDFDDEEDYEEESY